MGNKKPSNPRMTHPDGTYASEARKEDYVTLRDDLASKAMQGLLSNNSMIDSTGEKEFKWLAETSYQIADEMLKQRDVEN